MALNTRMRPSTGTPNDGSRTITIRDSQPREEGDEGADDVNADGVDQTGRNGRDGRDVGVLRLRGGPSNQPRVSWKEDVVDNEGMGKKKSKICCIYHKPRRFDESSSESSDSSSGDDDSGPDSDSDSGRAQPGGRLRNHRHNHSHGRRSHHDHHDCGDERAEGGSTRSTGRNGGGMVESIDPDKPDVNAYEKQPKSRKGKAVEH